MVRVSEEITENLKLVAMNLKTSFDRIWLQSMKVISGNLISRWKFMRKIQSPVWFNEFSKLSLSVSTFTG